MKKYLSLLLAVMMIVTACYTGFVVSAAEPDCAHANVSILPMIDSVLTDAGNAGATVKPTEFTQGMEPQFSFKFQNLRLCTDCKTYLTPENIDGDIEYNYYIYYDNQVAPSADAEEEAFSNTASAHMESSDKYFWNYSTAGYEQKYTTEYHGTGTWDGTTPIDINLATELQKGSNAWDNIVNKADYAGAVYIRLVMENDAARTAAVNAGTTPSTDNRVKYDGSIIFNRENITETAVNDANDWEAKMQTLVGNLGEMGDINLVNDGSDFIPKGTYTYSEIVNNTGNARATLTADLERYRNYWKTQAKTPGTTVAIIPTTISYPDNFMVYDVYVEAGGSDLEDVDFSAGNYVDDGKYLPTVGYLMIPLDGSKNAKSDLNLSIYYQGYGFYNPTPSVAANSFADTSTLEFRTNNMGYPLSMNQNILIWMQNNQLGCRNYDKEFSTTLNQSFETSYYNALVRRGLRAVQFIQYYAVNNGILAADSSKLSNVKVAGGSFGGFQSFAVAALDHDVKHLATEYPWMCNVAGRYYGQVGSSFLPSAGADGSASYASLTAFKYFDTVMFAKHLDKNTLVTIKNIGMGDSLCPVYGIALLHNTLKANGISVIAEYLQDSIHGWKTVKFTSGTDLYGNTGMSSVAAHNAYCKDDRALRNQNAVEYFDINGVEQSFYGENQEKNRLTFKTSAATSIFATTTFANKITIDSMVIEAPTDYIATGALKNVYNLEEFKFVGDGYVREIGQSIFEADWKLAALELPYGIEKIPGWALQYCGIKDLKIPCAGPEGKSLVLGFGSLNPFSPGEVGYSAYTSSVAIDESGNGGLGRVEFTYDETKTYGTLDTSAVGAYTSRILCYNNDYKLNTVVYVDEAAPTASAITGWWTGNKENHAVLPVNPDAVISFTPNADFSEYTMTFGKGVKVVSYSRINAAADSYAATDTNFDTSKVTKLIVLDGVTLVDSTNSGQTEGVFYKFQKIAEIEYDQGGYFKYIGKNAFYANDALEHLYLPTGLEGIGNSAIRQLKALKSITFAPATEKGIKFGDYCLAEMNNVDTSSTINITFEETNPDIPYTKGTGTVNSDGSTDIGRSIFGWGTPAYKIYVDCGTQAYTNMVYPNNTTVVNRQFSFDEKTGKLTIAPTVTELNSSVFNTSGVTKANVKEIYIKGKVALTIPDGCTYTFNGFTALEKLTFDEANGACVTSITGNGVFKNCSLKVLDLPVGLTLVGTYALNESAIRTLVIPAASKDAEGNIVPIELQNGAFSNGSFPLHTVTYEGKEAGSYVATTNKVINALWAGTAVANFYYNDAVFATVAKDGTSWSILNNEINAQALDLANPSVYMKWDDEKAQSIMMITGGTADAPATVTQSLINAAGAGYNAKISGAIVLIDGVVALGTSAFNTTDGIPIITDLQYTDGSYITSTGQATFSNKQFRVENLVFPEGLTSFGDYTFQQNTYVKTITFPSTLKKLPDNAFCNGGSYGIGKVTWYTDTIESLKALSTVATSAETTEFVVTNLACYNAVVAAKTTYSTDTFWSKLAVTSITGTNGAAISEFTQGVDDNGGLTISGYTGTATSVVLPKGATKVTALKDGITEITANEDVTIENGVLAAGTVINGSLDYTELCSYALNKDNAVFLMVSDEEAATLKEGDYTGDKTVDIRDHARLKKHLKDVSGSTTTVGLLKQAAKENCDASGNINANAVVALCKAIITAIAG